MARFVIRIELHGAGQGDYNTLDSAMKAEGIRHTITSGDGTTYRLPTGEYYFDGATLARDAVLEAANRAAGKTGKKSEILVTEAQVSTWSGLQVVPQ